MAINGASYSHEAGSTGLLNKRVSRPVQLVPELKPFWIYKIVITRHQDYLHIRWFLNSAAIDERHVRRILKVVGLSFSHHYVVDQELDKYIIYFINGIYCEFEFENAWARDAE